MSEINNELKKYDDIVGQGIYKSFINSCIQNKLIILIKS